jgi:hypothetical protein
MNSCCNIRQNSKTAIQRSQFHRNDSAPTPFVSAGTILSHLQQLDEELKMKCSENLRRICKSSFEKITAQDSFQSSKIEFWEGGGAPCHLPSVKLEQMEYKLKYLFLDETNKRLFFDACNKQLSDDCKYGYHWIDAVGQWRYGYQNLSGFFLVGESR